MKIWYKAVCDEHKEMSNVLVRGHYNMYNFSKIYLEEKERTTVSWLSAHNKCSLRIIHRDDELDFCFENKYTQI